MPLESSPAHYQYDLTLEGRRIIGIRQNAFIIKRFNLPKGSQSTPKLYIIKHQGKIVYVGITAQRLSLRLAYGLLAEERKAKNYKGYAWKDLNEVSLLVYLFPDNCIKHVEAVEAEVVYLVRHYTGEWPVHQTEIHFANDPEAKKTARTIYSQASS